MDDEPRRDEKSLKYLCTDCKYLSMARLGKRIARMRRNPGSVSWVELVGVCDALFGKPARISGSHRIYDVRWSESRWLVLQPRGSSAKPYQVRQVLRAADELGHHNGHT